MDRLAPSSNELSARGIGRSAWFIAVTIVQFGAVFFAGMLVKGFWSTVLASPRDHAGDAVALLGSLFFAGLALAFLIYGLWVGILLLARSRHFPLAWVLEGIASIAWILVAPLDFESQFLSGSLILVLFALLGSMRPANFVSSKGRHVTGPCRRPDRTR